VGEAKAKKTAGNGHEFQPCYDIFCVACVALSEVNRKERKLREHLQKERLRTINPSISERQESQQRDQAHQRTNQTT
jgi:hypothetical protein